MNIVFRSLWERYFIKETLKFFFLFIFCFYALYVLIDFSSNSRHFHYQGSYHWGEIFLYYLAEFAKRLDVLAPFGLLLATVKTVIGLNIHQELIALMASGIPLRSLLRPFILLGVFAAFAIYANTEWLLPKALAEIKTIDRVHHSHKKNKGKSGVQHLILEDNSTLLFQSYNSEKGSFFDVYWIKEMNDIYKFKYLYPYTEIPVGEFVDHFVRNKEGNMEKQESYPLRLFPEITFNKAKIVEMITSKEELSLTELFKQMPLKLFGFSEHEAQIATMFYYKLAMPWLSLLALLVAIPLCVRYTRDLPVFLIYAISIFTLVFIYLVLDAQLILGKGRFSPLFLQ